MPSVAMGCRCAVTSHGCLELEYSPVDFGTANTAELSERLHDDQRPATHDRAAAHVAIRPPDVLIVRATAERLQVSVALTAAVENIDLGWRLRRENNADVEQHPGWVPQRDPERTLNRRQTSSQSIVAATAPGVVHAQSCSASGPK
jgi:hypothetical protein